MLSTAKSKWIAVVIIVVLAIAATLLYKNSDQDPLQVTNQASENTEQVSDTTEQISEQAKQIPEQSEQSDSSLEQTQQTDEQTVQSGLSTEQAQSSEQEPPSPAMFTAGKHYQIIKDPVPTAKPDEIEVTEVFWYGCGHCNNFRPIFAEWKEQLPDGVYTRHSPAMWRQNMRIHARIFYTAKAMGIQEKVHKDIFDAMHVRGAKLERVEEIYPIFKAHGITSEADIKNTFNSFGVKAMVDQADARARGYGITGTPEVIVNGKYRISSSMVMNQTVDGCEKVRGRENYCKMLKVAEFLIAKEKADQSPPSKS